MMGARPLAEQEATLTLAVAKQSTMIVVPKEIKKLDEVVVNRIAAGEVSPGF
jgi:hypothetical protein